MNVKTKMSLVTAAMAVPAFVAVAQQPFPSSPRPREGTATYIRAADWNARLAKNVAKRPNLAVAGIGITTDYIVLVAHRGKAAGAISHPDAHELHYILDGSGTLVTGGKIVRSKGSRYPTIEGGETRHVRKGDVIIIPKNTPHWYSHVDGTLTYLEIRFKAPSE